MFFDGFRPAPVSGRPCLPGEGSVVTLEFLVHQVPLNETQVDNTLSGTVRTPCGKGAKAHEHFR